MQTLDVCRHFSQRWSAVSSCGEVVTVCREGSNWSSTAKYVAFADASVKGNVLRQLAPAAALWP